MVERRDTLRLERSGLILMGVRIPLPVPKDHMTKRLTFQERALVRNELAQKLIDTLDFWKANSYTNRAPMLVDLRKSIEDVATRLLEIK